MLAQLTATFAPQGCRTSLTVHPFFLPLVGQIRPLVPACNDPTGRLGAAGVCW